MTVKSFTFGPFSENTYILYDATKECVIVDPGCYDEREKKELTRFIEENKLKPMLLLNTHGHIDHVVGNKFIFEQYGLLPMLHKEDLTTLHSLIAVANLYNLNAEVSPEPAGFLKEGDKVKFGSSELAVLFTPGHSPGSICFVHAAQKIIVSGDVLFYGSIGRSDLPGGNSATLLNSIADKLMVLEDDYTVYSGHGQPTTIGFERKNNPFLH
jgi:hydroxyacylglutathione hydrolase